MIIIQCDKGSFQSKVSITWVADYIYRDIDILSFAKLLEVKDIAYDAIEAVETVRYDMGAIAAINFAIAAS